VIDSLPGFPDTDRYQPLAELGRGGSGVVFLAYDRKERLRVAMKTLHRFTADDLSHLKREFRCLAGLGDPHVIQLYELAASETGQCYLTMEYVEGVSFLRYVRAPPGAGAGSRQEPSQTDGAGSRISPPFDEVRLRDALVQVAQGLAALHRAGFLHRDVKPSNVVISADGRARVIDFNLVQNLRVDPLAPGLPQRPAGTPVYMSPEQLNNQPLTPASDWYSFGVMLYEALAGSLPARGDASRSESRRDAILPCTGQQLDRTFSQRQARAASRRAFPDLRRSPDLPSDLAELCMDLLHESAEQRPRADEILERLGAAGSRRRAGATGTTDPFVGRARQLAELDEALSAVRRGATVAVEVSGPSGVGKTALLRHFLEHLDPSARALVLAGRCFERESMPYNALDELVEGLCHYLRRLPPADAKVLMPRNCQSLARLFTCFLGVRSFFPAGSTPPDALDPIEQRRRGFAAFKELLGRLAEQSTLILYLDDLQWGDADSAHLLEDLLRPPDAPPMLLLTCSRIEGTASESYHRALDALRTARNGSEVRSIALEPLPAADAEALAVALLEADDTATQGWAAAIARESEGHPYLLKELCRYSGSRRECCWPRWGAADPVRKRGSAGSACDPALMARADGLGGSVPTLDEVLHARIQRLPEVACRLLETVATAGGPLAESVAVDAADVIGADRYYALALLQREHLVRTSLSAGERLLEPYHDRIREAFARWLPPERARAAHGRLAAALEEWGRADAQVLALHHAAAGARGKAAKFAAAAAAKAAESLAFENAASLYRMALSLEEPDAAGVRTLRVRLGDVLANIGRGPEAAAAYLEAAQGADLRQALDLQRRAAEQLLISGHIDEGTRLMNEVLSAVGMRLATSPRRALLSLLWRRLLVALSSIEIAPRRDQPADEEDLLRMDICWSVGRGLATVDVVRANDFQTRHLLLAQRGGDRTRLARAMAMEIGVTAVRGGPQRQRTQRMIERAKALANEVDDPHALGLVAFMEGIAEYLVGRWRSTVGLLERAETILRDRCTNVSWEIINAQRFAHSALWFLGYLRELSDKLPALLHSARELGNVYAVSAGGRNAHLLGLANDDPEAAQESLEETIAGLPRTGFHVQHYNLLLSRAQILLYVGAAQTAWDTVQTEWRALTRSLLMRTQLLRMEAWSLRARCALALAASGHRDAGRLLGFAEEDAARIARENMAWGNPYAAVIHATVEHLSANPEAAQAGLRQAATGFADAEMYLCAAAVRHRLGTICGAPGLVAEAEEWMRDQRIKNPPRMAAMLVPGF
jgi:eukaryotic-like serine/threonine-protein kinase